MSYRAQQPAGGAASAPDPNERWVRRFENAKERLPSAFGTFPVCSEPNEQRNATFLFPSAL